ncbi:DUF2934 domain-containing protein, partial [Pseudomonas sp.]
MSADDKRIREFAYQIWESEGKPEGHEDRHWEMARKLAEAEALAPSKPGKAKAAAKPKGASTAPLPTKEKPAPVAKSAPPKPAAAAAPKPKVATA